MYCHILIKEPIKNLINHEYYSFSITSLKKEKNEDRFFKQVKVVFLILCISYLV